MHLTNLHPTTSALLSLPCLAGHRRQFNISDSEWIVLSVSSVGLLIIDPTTHCLKAKICFISSSRKSTKCDTFFDYFGENPNALFHRYAQKKKLTLALFRDVSSFATHMVT